jgi:hypothetical protein
MLRKLRRRFHANRILFYGMRQDVLESNLGMIDPSNWYESWSEQANAIVDNKRKLNHHRERWLALQEAK